MKMKRKKVKKKSKEIERKNRKPDKPHIGTSSLPLQMQKTNSPEAETPSSSKLRLKAITDSPLPKCGHQTNDDTIERKTKSRAIPI